MTSKSFIKKGNIEEEQICGFKWGDQFRKSQVWGACGTCWWRCLGTGDTLLWGLHLLSLLLMSGRWVIWWDDRKLRFPAPVSGSRCARLACQSRRQAPWNQSLPEAWRRRKSKRTRVCNQNMYEPSPWRRPKGRGGIELGKKSKSGPRSSRTEPEGWKVLTGFSN